MSSRSTCKRRRARLAAQAAEFRPDAVAVVDDGRDFAVPLLPGLKVY